MNRLAALSLTVAALVPLAACNNDDAPKAVDAAQAPASASATSTPEPTASPTPAVSPEVQAALNATYPFTGVITDTESEGPVVGMKIDGSFALHVTCGDTLPCTGTATSATGAVYNVTWNGSKLSGSTKGTPNQFMCGSPSTTISGTLTKTLSLTVTPGTATTKARIAGVVGNTNVAPATATQCANRQESTHARIAGTAR